MTAEIELPKVACLCFFSVGFDSFIWLLKVNAQEFCCTRCSVLKFVQWGWQEPV